jgi:ankyrin repeat protein
MENKLNKNPLHLAVEESNLIKIKNLAGKNFINQQDTFKNTPLHLAIKAGDLKIINELLKYDFDPEIKDESGFDILDLAIKNKNSVVIGRIIDKFKPENKPELLFFAAKYYPEIIPLLISKGYKKDYLNEKGENLLMEYLKYNDNFPNFPTTIDHFDSQRNTPLHIYLIYQNDIHLDIIEKFEPYFYTIPNKSGMTPLDLLIIEHNRNDLFEHLVKKHKININERDNLGNTLLHRLAKKGNEKLIELLLDLGADINLQNVKGDTPLHLFFKNKLPLNYHKIMELCPNLFIRNKLGKVPLFYARGQIKVKLDKTFIPHIDKILSECKIFNKKLNKKLISVNKNNSGYTLFTGTGLNEIMGIAYLKQKYSDLCFVLGPEKIYSGIGDTNRFVIDYSKYNIIWDGKVIEFPKDFKNHFKMLMESPGCRFLIVPITLIPIVPEESLHANYLVIDKTKKIAERFEPHGGLSQYFYCTDNLDSEIIKELGITFQYYRPIDFLPIVGFQTLQSYENFVYLLNRVGDPEGFCAAWGLYYLDLRFANPDIPPKELVKIGIEELLADSRELTDFIRDYSAYIIKERNGVLNKIVKKKNIIEEKLSGSQMKKIESYIRDLFKSPPSTS